MSLPPPQEAAVDAVPLPLGAAGACATPGFRDRLPGGHCGPREERLDVISLCVHRNPDLLGAE